MTKRRLFRWSLILVTLGAFAVWLEPTRVVWGWLRGEAFYQRRPTSWWRHELTRWTLDDNDTDPSEPPWRGTGRKFLEHSFSRSATKWEELWAELSHWFHKRTIEDDVAVIAKVIREASGPPILHGDPAARCVLEELAKDDAIQQLVAFGLKRIRE